METPLLASDEGDTPPSLSNGPMTVDTTNGEESSGLVFSLLAGEHPELTIPLVHSTSTRTTIQEPAFAKAFFTIFTGALTLLHIGFVWGSYLSPSWSDTLLNVSIQWLGDSMNVVRSTNLGSCFEIFLQAHCYFLLGCLIVTCLAIPCLAMILHPLRIGPAFQFKFQFLETWCRTALLVVYALSILNLAISFIDLEWTDTQIAFKNRLRGGLASFIVGTSASMIAATLFRIRRVKHFQRQQRTRAVSAFEFFPTATRPFRNNTNEIVSPQNGKKRGCMRKILAWEFGLLAFVLLVPMATLPVLKISYSGLAAQFMPNISKKVYLWQFPLLIWKHGMAAGSQWYMVAACVAASILHVSIVPIMALALGLGVWIKGKGWCKQVLYCFYPNVNSITFAVALLLMVPSLQSVGEILFDKDAYGLCQKFDNLLGETCLSVSGTVLWGAWFCLGQAVALELFILLTLLTFP